jgi:nitroimidazol reductase NimA-like FMN-containing flavoprotein (pyridoxamine 5'-phosphate oxidase superfamily)
MLDRIHEIIRENDICVLATTGAGGPHTSLMAYVCSADVRTITLVTARNTRKYQNLCTEPRVSLLVDTRDRDARGNVRALTIEGVSALIQDAATVAEAHAEMLRRHPHLHGLMEQPDIVFVRVAIESVQMLTGPLEARRIRFSNSDGA